MMDITYSRFDVQSSSYPDLVSASLQIYQKFGIYFSGKLKIRAYSTSRYIFTRQFRRVTACLFFYLFPLVPCTDTVKTT